MPTLLPTFAAVRLARWVQQRASALPSALTGFDLTSRVEVRPPQSWPSSRTFTGRLQRWRQRQTQLGDAFDGARSAAVPPALEQARREFRATLADLSGDAAWSLVERVDHARTLRELWYLRSTLYGVVATLRDQAEAERRLSCVNRHFPLRGTRRATPADVVR